MMSVSTSHMKWILSVISLVVIWTPDLTTQNQYCSISKDHTLCKFQGVGPRCKTPFEIGIPQSDRNLIMELHNTLRRMVTTGGERRGKPGPQPMAANMRQMEWDDELALSAQRLAEQCKYNHDCLNCRKVDRFLTGQNLYQFSENLMRDGSNWEQAIMAWYDEVALFNPKSIDRFEFIKELGHYTAMLWADTWKVGCGYVYYKDGKWNRKLYVCNYGPAGNIITTQMYKRGTPCSECPEGTTCSNQYPGLCSAGGRSSFFAQPPPAPLAPVTQRPTKPSTTRRPTTTTTTTTRKPTTISTTTTTTTTTTPRPRPTTTAPPSKIIFDEIESNEIGGIDTFRQPQPFDITSRFGVPSSSKKNNLESNSRNNFFGSAKNTSQRNRFQTTTISPFKRPQQQQSFSRFATTRRPTKTTATTTTKTRPKTTPLPPPTTTYNQIPVTFYNPTTKKPITFSPRIYPEQQQKLKQNNRNRPINDNRIPSGTINQSRFSTLNSNANVNNFPSNNNFNTKQSSSKQKVKGGAETTILKNPNTNPALSVEDSESIMLFCDFDYAKCPVRYTGQLWNYTAYETPGYGHGFASIIGPGADSALQIRSDVYPTGSEGLICVHFRFVLYTFGIDGGPARTSNGIGRDGKSVRFIVTATSSRQNPSLVEINERSKSAYDWQTGRIQFRDLHSQFLLNFQLPKNSLGDNVYLAVDDILITQGICHT